MDRKLIEIDTFKEILHARARAAEMPFDIYIDKLIYDKDFISPTLSQETIKIIKFRIALLHGEKELKRIRTNLIKLKIHCQKYNSNDSLMNQIEKKLYLVEKLLNKFRIVRLNLNYHSS